MSDTVSDAVKVFLEKRGLLWAVRNRALGIARKPKFGLGIVTVWWPVVWFAKHGYNWALRVLAHELTHHAYWLKQAEGLLPSDYKHHHPSSDACIMLGADGWRNGSWLHSEADPSAAEGFAVLGRSALGISNGRAMWSTLPQ